MQPPGLKEAATKLLSHKVGRMSHEPNFKQLRRGLIMASWARGPTSGWLSIPAGDRTQQSEHEISESTNVFFPHPKFC